VILENRYYGHSYPFPNSTTDNLRFLTTEQSMPAGSTVESFLLNNMY